MRKEAFFLLFIRFLNSKKAPSMDEENLYLIVRAPVMAREALFLTKKKRPSQMEKSVSLSSRNKVICLVSIIYYANITCDPLNLLSMLQ